MAEKFYTTYEQTADKETEGGKNSMKKKIAYLTITAAIAVTAFFVGKNFTEPTQQPETKTPELTEMTVESGGLYLEYTDGENFYSYWIPLDDLEKAGLIYTANIVE